MNRPDWQLVLQADHIKRLEEENKKLKAEKGELRQFLSKEPLALQALQSAYASYKKSSEVWADIAKDYKQTLTEIKEIAENRGTYPCSKCINKQILQKISEVMND